MRRRGRKEGFCLLRGDHYMGRIERHDGKINAICVRDFARGLDAARAADAARGRGETRPLLGLPLTVKESYNIAGLPTTWGFPAQKDFMPADDALSISRVKQAGAVILGKTNVPLGLADWQSFNEIYGTTSNPYDLGRTPGGSSGGSSAALAAGYGPLSLGSDSGGSLRVPAFHCGVYAHKPTFALAPSRGHTPPPMASCASSTAETCFAARADDNSTAVLKLHSDLAKARFSCFHGFVRGR